ncbi:MAG: hypothetical protein FWD91_05075 [Treponema sp.]|nr:hypothetical protein [Treponema sp.]
MKRRFVVGLAAVLAAVILSIAMAGCQSQGARSQTPGWYEGTARGQIGDVTVRLRVEEGVIAEVDYTYTADTRIDRHETLFKSSVPEHQNFTQFIVDGVSGATGSKWGLAAAGQIAARNALGASVQWPQVFSASAEQASVEGNGRYVSVFLCVDKNGKILDGYATHAIRPARTPLGDFFAVTAMPMVVRSGSFDVNALKPAFDAARNAAAADVQPLFIEEAFAAFISAGNAAIAKAR